MLAMMRMMKDQEKFDKTPEVSVLPDFNWGGGFMVSESNIKVISR